MDINKDIEVATSDPDNKSDTAERPTVRIYHRKGDDTFSIDASHGTKLPPGKKVVYWAVHLENRNDGDAHKLLTYTSYDTEKEAKSHLPYLDKNGLHFRWEWKRKGNFDVYYVYEQTSDGIDDETDYSAAD